MPPEKIKSPASLVSDVQAEGKPTKHIVLHKQSLIMLWVKSEAKPTKALFLHQGCALGLTAAWKKHIATDQ